MGEEKAEDIRPQQRKQQLTIFYNGTVSVSDVTEFQARAIMMLASSEETEEMWMTATTASADKQHKEKRRNGGSGESGDGSSSEPTSPSSGHHYYHPPPPPLLQLYSPRSLYMKRSLQRFLQKRKHRIQDTASPYHRDP